MCMFLTVLLVQVEKLVRGNYGRGKSAAHSDFPHSVQFRRQRIDRIGCGVAIAQRTAPLRPVVTAGLEGCCCKT